MTPATLTDEELLRLYDDVFRQHPATAELAERMVGGGRAAQLEVELEAAQEDAESSEKECVELRDKVDVLAEALENLMESRSNANLAAAQKALDAL